MMHQIKGLTAEQATQSRAENGSNELAQQRPDSFFRQFLNGFKDPMIQILSVVAVVMLILFFAGFGEWFEPVGTLIAIVLVNSVTAKTGVSNDRAYRKLKNSMQKETAKVIRDGKVQVICADDLVVGDWVLLQAGDKVLADGVLRQGEVTVENSVLNGEMEEVHKTAAADDFVLPDSLSGDCFVDAHSLFRGAVVLSGEGYLCIERVGTASMMGKMAAEMRQKEPPSPLQVKLRHLAKQISVFGYVGAVVIALLYAGLMIFTFRGEGGTAGLSGWSGFWHQSGGMIASALIRAVVIAVTLMICAVPEGLPLVIALVLMQNTGKLYRANVLVRKSIGIETAGSLNILFSDKTGTITKGQLEVMDWLLGNGESVDLQSDGAAKAAEECYRTIAATTAAVFDAEHRAVGGNLTDHALLTAAGEANLAPFADLEVEAKEDFSSARKFSQAYVPKWNRTYCKGAPERLLEKAAFYLGKNGELLPIDLTRLNAKIDELAEKAFRVLAFGYYNGPLTEAAIGDGLVVVGLVCIRDEVRDGVKAAIAEVHGAGIQVVMITGDRKETAAAIAADAGLFRAGRDLALTSAQLAAMSDEEVKAALPNIRVIARALPTDKSRMVRLCRELNWVVGMTGDGVNDSPALKTADVGFAMGSGTEVAKEAGKLVILDDNFLSIKNAIWYGRTLYINILKFCKMQLAINIAAVAVSALCPFLGPLLGLGTIEPPLKVTHLLWINLCMDSLASIMFATEPALPGYMKRPPRRRDEKIINKSMAVQISVAGSWLTLISLLWFTVPGLSRIFPDKAQLYSGFFTMFVFAFMVNAFNVRTDGFRLFRHLNQNRNFLKIWLMIIAIQVLLATLPGVGKIFGCVPFGWKGWLTAIGFALTMVPIDFVRKALLLLTGLSGRAREEV